MAEVLPELLGPMKITGIPQFDLHLVAETLEVADGELSEHQELPLDLETVECSVPSKCLARSK